MKTLKYLSFMLMLMVCSAGFTSCSDDDDDVDTSVITDYYMTCTVSGGGFTSQEIDRLQSLLNKELVGFFNPDNSRENIERKFYEEVDNELLDMINSRLDLYNKLSGGRANERVKKLLFEQFYDRFMAANS